jgi:RNA polymerase sigma-70 factor (ECF subfamily)
VPKENEIDKHSEEQALLIQVARGDREAFRLLYAKFSKRVYNTALSYLQDANEAEEATQDVFVQIFSSAGGFSGKSSVRTWIYRITINQCLDRIRHRKRKKRLGVLVQIFGSKGEVIHDSPDFNHPGIAMEKQEAARILWTAIDRLPEQQRAAYILTYIEELSGKEVAEVMLSSPRAVESLIQRAKANLRKLVDRGEV